jgi:hypothetical protein
VPWCDPCSKFWTPTSLTETGACPDCGQLLEKPVGPTITAKNLNIKELAGVDQKVPWHFKLMVGALALYLGWRVVQLIVWLVR